MQIDGYFNANDEPAIQLDLGSGAIEIVVDTGFSFSGSLIIPTSLASGLALQIEGFEEFLTATGQLFVAPAYSLEIDWLGQRTRVALALSPNVGEALMGSDLLKNCRLTIDYYDRTVTITQRT